MQSEFSLVSSECVPMTKELASKFQDMEPSPTERDLDPLRVKHLSKKADEGQLVTFHWATALIEGKEVRMNGQHSSTMLSGLNGDFPDGLYCHMDHYKVESEKGLALLFRQFDDRKSSRGPSDIAGAYQGLYKDVRDVPKVVAKNGISGIAYYLKWIEGAPVPTGDDMWTMFDRSSDYPFLHWLGEVFTQKTGEMVHIPLIASMYSTYNADEVKAKKFWASVARGGDEYNECDPAAKLDKWLLSLKGITDTAKKPKPANKYQAGVFCYNAFVEERDVKTVKTDTKKGWFNPIVS